MEDICTAPWYYSVCKEVSPYDLLQRKHVVKLVLKSVSRNMKICDNICARFDKAERILIQLVNYHNDQLTSDQNHWPIFHLSKIEHP